MSSLYVVIVTGVCGMVWACSMNGWWKDTKEVNWKVNLKEEEQKEVHTETPTRCKRQSKFISYLYEGQHVSGETPLFIRSLKLH